MRRGDILMRDSDARSTLGVTLWESFLARSSQSNGTTSRHSSTPDLRQGRKGLPRPNDLSYRLPESLPCERVVKGSLLFGKHRNGYRIPSGRGDRVSWGVCVSGGRLHPTTGYHTTPDEPHRNTNTHRTRAIQPMK